MTIDHAIQRGVVSAEPTNDLSLSFAFVRRDEEIEYVEPFEDNDVPEVDDYTANFIINRL
jgi:hypothetical protein